MIKLFFRVMFFFLLPLSMMGNEVIESFELSGKIVDEENQAIVGAIIHVKNTTNGTSSNIKGEFKLANLAPKNCQIIISALGYKSKEIECSIKSSGNNFINVVLEKKQIQLNQVTISEKTQASETKESGFSVEVIETKQLQVQTTDINRVLDRTAGVRIRQSGGMGSDFNYSLNGLSGKSIKFFVDGIPMDYFGRSYAINNYPISLIERIEIYKGVVPVDLGSDALGGAINLVSKKTVRNFIEASYSFGSFNTHQTSLQGQWIEKKSNLTFRASTFLNKSENNYKVWGKGVTYADASTGHKPIEFTKENPAERFNDDFQTFTSKSEIGFINKKWADQLFGGIIFSELNQGIQNGQTMAYVYGNARYTETLKMPFLTFKKDNIAGSKVSINLFSAYLIKDGTTVDTTSNLYDWRGAVVNSGGAGGEINTGQGKSAFTLIENAAINRANLTYQINRKQKIGVNYLANYVLRTGEDPYQPWYRTAYLAPQSLFTQFAGFSYESKWLNDRINSNVFLKYFNYNASINEGVLTTNENGEQKYISKDFQNQQESYGGGWAVSFKATEHFQPKFSIEQTTRMPDATEALGNGIIIINNPLIKPEQSLNINLGLYMGKFQFNQHQIKASISGFFRNTKDLLLLTVISSRGLGQYQNIEEVQGLGAEFDFAYQYKWIEFTANTTYLDLRNNQEFDPTYANQKNIVYRDRLRNTPYFMANAGLRIKFQNVFQKESSFFISSQCGFVHEYYLGWPSLGIQSLKNTIPHQFVTDLGIGYTFPKQNLTLALDATNIFNEQVFDNFLLQRPGRAFFIKATYNFNFKNNSINN